MQLFFKFSGFNEELLFKKNNPYVKPRSSEYGVPIVACYLCIVVQLQSNVEEKKPRYVFFGMFSVQFILYSIIKPSFIWPKALDIFFKQLCDSLFNFYWIYLKTQKFRQCVQITEKNTEAKRLLEYAFIHMLTPHPPLSLLCPHFLKKVLVYFVTPLCSSVRPKEKHCHWNSVYILRIWEMIL